MFSQNFYGATYAPIQSAPNTDYESVLDAAYAQGEADRLAGNKCIPSLNGDRLFGMAKTLYQSGWRNAVAAA